MGHASASISFHGESQTEIASISREKNLGAYITITWKDDDDVNDLTVFLELEEAVTFVQELSAVVFAAKAGVFTDDTSRAGKASS